MTKLTKGDWGRPMIRLDGTQWTTLTLPEDHPAFAQFRELHAQTVGQDYTEQQEWLDKINEKEGADVFVASFSGAEDKEAGEFFTWCSWAEGVLAWLPRTDRIGLVRAGVHDGKPEVLTFSP